MTVDIHTHNRGTEGILSLEPAEVAALPKDKRQPISVGFHPWNITPGGPSPEEWKLFEEMASWSDVVAIGESGLDLLRGPVLAIQMNVFRREAEIAQRLGKPLIIHCVKAFEQLIGIKKEVKPTVPWLIHGFRGKSGVARMLAKSGFWFSLGPRFNPSSLQEIPTDRLLAETDDSEISISEIISSIGAGLGLTSEESTLLVRNNLVRFLGGGNGVIT